MPAKNFVMPYRPAFESNAIPIPGAKAHFTYTGTTTPAPIYEDSGLSVSAANPVEANGAGRFPQTFIDESITYRLRIFGPNDDPLTATPIEEYDPYEPVEQGTKGDRGPQGYSVVTLEQLKAAPTTDGPLSYDQAVFAYLTDQDYSSLWDDENYIESDAGGTGAWVRQGADKVRARDGANIQQSIGVASNAGELLLTTQSLSVGSVIRTSDGFIYEVAPSDATDAHLTTAGGAKLYYLFENSYVHLAALGGVDTSGATDCAPILQKAISLLPVGGTIEFPQGTIRLESQITISTPSITFVGSGRRKVYPGVFTPSRTAPTTLLAAHGGTAAIRFFNATINQASSFYAYNINLATLETGDRPICAFGFDGSGNFHRDYTFERCGIFGFTSAFDTYNTGGDTAFGLIKITDCAINRNTWIARNLTGQWNGFLFERNESGQNGNATNMGGGIDIKGQAVIIRSNSLEGQRNTIRVTGSYRSTIIEGNYFELNSGDYVISLSNTDGAYIGTNFWQNIPATEKIKLFADVGTIVDDKVVPSTDGSFDLKTRWNSIDPVPTGAATAAMFADPSFVKSMLNGMTEIGGYTTSAPAGPHFAIPDSAGSLYTSAGTGITTITKTGLTIAASDYVLVVMLISYEDEPAVPPRFIVNAVGAGSAPGIFYNWNGTQKLKGKSVLYAGIVRATGAATQVQTQFYPFGLNPAAGLKCYFSVPAIYNLGSAVPEVLNGGNGVELQVPNTHVQMVTAAPTVGIWPVGYRLKARTPAAAGKVGFICTTAGTPGTWKPYGAIDA